MSLISVSVLWKSEDCSRSMHYASFRTSSERFLWDQTYIMYITEYLRFRFRMASSSCWAFATCSFNLSFKDWISFKCRSSFCWYLSCISLIRASYFSFNDRLLCSVLSLTSSKSAFSFVSTSVRLVWAFSRSRRTSPKSFSSWFPVSFFFFGYTDTHAHVGSNG